MPKFQNICRFSTLMWEQKLKMLLDKFEDLKYARVSRQIRTVKILGKNIRKLPELWGILSKLPDLSTFFELN